MGGMQPGLVGWLKDKQKDKGGTNKGRASACMGKKARPLGNEWCSRHPWGLDLGACDPCRLWGVVGGLVKRPHCFCVTVVTTHPVQLVVINELLLTTANSPVTHQLKDPAIQQPPALKHNKGNIWIMSVSNRKLNILSYIYQASVWQWNAISPKMLHSFFELWTALLH